MPLIGKPVGKAAKAVGDIHSSTIFQSPLNKLWRALLLLNRKTSVMPKDNSGKSAKINDAKNFHVARPESLSPNQASDPWMTNRMFARNGEEDIMEMLAIDFTVANKRVLEQIRNEIVIANLESTPPVSIVIQNRPDELRVESTPTWATVKSMGRNNPFYFYTGGEDQISFEVSWFSVDAEHRDDVVNKCRLLESWTKANGYSASPPNLKIQWGDSGLFENDSFILVSASYTLSHFQNAQRAMKRYDNDPDTGQRIGSSVSRPMSLKLLPNVATQSLVFKRVSRTNRTWEDIIPSSKLKYTPGVIIDSVDSNSLETSESNKIGTP